MRLSLRPWAGLVLAASALVLLNSCATLGLVDEEAEPEPGSESSSSEANPFALALLDGLDDSGKFGFAVRSLRSMNRANENLTPEQEYYLGRAFGAQVLATRSPLGNAKLDRYVNQIGQALARFSDRPETWIGYRFLVLDTPEVNAFAAPGGLIFVTKGLIAVTRNEAELAAVLAHEIAHVDREHGLKAVRKDRLAKAAVGIGADAVQTFGDSRLQEVVTAFEDSVTDLTRTIVNSGYSRETEYEADAQALVILTRAGYPPQALVTMLEALKRLPKAGEGGFTKTHPTPDQRLAEVNKEVGRSDKYSVSPTQKRRFSASLDGL